MNVIETRNLCKQYGKKTAVIGMNMHVQQGDIYGFIGRNGSGKSTTLKMLCGLAHPTAGSIRLFGQPAEDISVRRRVGALIETTGFDPTASAYENMMRKAILMGISDPKPEIEKLLMLCGLNAADRKKTKQFSMGMKQRLGIAMALLGGPDLLILDEPINGLDPEGMAGIRRLFVTLNEERGITILISSHILGELSKIATRYGILKDGVLIREITSEQLYSACRDYLYVKVTDAQKAAAALEEFLDIHDYEIQPEGEVRIFEPADSAAVTQALLEHHIGVVAIYPHRQNLEEYFLELMEEKTPSDPATKKGGRHNA